MKFYIAFLYLMVFAIWYVGQSKQPNYQIYPYQHYQPYPYPQYQPYPYPPQPTPPQTYTISPCPIEWINYDRVVALLRTWNQEAPEITEFGTYGQTSRGTTLTYLRTGTRGKPKILIHACLHGNERLSTGATLWIIQKMLHEYGRDSNITWLIQNRDVYWVPVLSPDTYLESRHVEGRDPNRDYFYPGRRPHNPTSPVKAIQDFHIQQHFVGVISGHTTGQVYLWPSLATSKDRDIHQELAQKMSDISNYRNRAISSSANGYEIDFYYWKGAISILTEFGSGSHNQPTSNIEPHGSRNYLAYMLFIKESPEYQLQLEKIPYQIKPITHTYHRRPKNIVTFRFSRKSNEYV